MCPINPPELTSSRRSTGILQNFYVRHRLRSPSPLHHSDRPETRTLFPLPVPPIPKIESSMRRKTFWPKMQNNLCEPESDEQCDASRNLNLEAAPETGTQLPQIMKDGLRWAGLNFPLQLCAVRRATSP